MWTLFHNITSNILVSQFHKIFDISPVMSAISSGILTSLLVFQYTALIPLELCQIFYLTKSADVFDVTARIYLGHPFFIITKITNTYIWYSCVGGNEISTVT